MKTKSFFRPVLIILASALGALGLASCHTVHGIGTDVKSAGRGIERTADSASR